MKDDFCWFQFFGRAAFFDIEPFTKFVYKYVCVCPFANMIPFSESLNALFLDCLKPLKTITDAPSVSFDGLQLRFITQRYPNRTPVAPDQMWYCQ